MGRSPRERRRVRGAGPFRDRPQAAGKHKVSPLADTSVLVDYLRGVEPARELMRSAVEHGEFVCASVLSRIELSIGMRRAERRRTDALVAALRWLPVDAVVADQADKLARRFAQSHSGID